MDNSSLSPSNESRRGSGLRRLGRILASPFSRSRREAQIRVIQTSPETANQNSPGGKTLNIKRNKARTGSGVYIDVENLQGEAQDLISSLMFNWPDTAPTPSRLTLYVRADQVELWRLWAVDQFNTVQVIVKGIQHFSRDSSKNSADIAIATNAIADFVRGRIAHVVVLSDDSDFISLYASIHDEVDQNEGATPFLWVVTDRHKSLSANVKQFVPRNILHVISADVRSPKSPHRPHPAGLEPPSQDVPHPQLPHPHPHPRLRHPLHPSLWVAPGPTWPELLFGSVLSAPSRAPTARTSSDATGPATGWPGQEAALSAPSSKRASGRSLKNLVSKSLT